jgi:hypothetical protein
MINNPNQPKEYDAVLGGDAPPPVTGAILGGIKGVKQRLESPLVEARVSAISEIMKYGDAGLDLAITALHDVDKQVQRSAYLLLRERTESHVKQALRKYKSWSLPERLDWYLDGRVSQFANRIVEDFNPITGVTDPAGVAYALRVGDDEGDNQNTVITTKLEVLLQDPQASKIEALVFGMWDLWGERDSRIAVNALVAAKDQLKNLQAVFIGDIEYSEWMISSIEQSDISPVLKAYPNLEVLQIRGATSLAFSELRHENLKALIIESGGISSRTITQLCALDLPGLEHLELWLGSFGYGGDSSVDNLMPILSGELFPMLSYLGLRNSEYSDDIAHALVNTPAIKFLKILDLAMGTLSDEGAKALLNCSDVPQLDILNVCENFLSNEIIEQLQQLHIQVITHSQKREYHNYNPHRYCSISE